jgi:anaerobic selenocysteine-containing dehydrogenase
MKEQDRDNSRREFLKTGAAIGAGAAASALLPWPAAAEVEASQESAGKKKGYQLTQHVLDYYKSAKL